MTQLGIQHQLRRDTKMNLSGYNGPQGEMLIDTSFNRLVVQDGATSGGFPSAMGGLQTLSTSQVLAATSAVIMVTQSSAVTLTLPAAANYPAGQMLTVVDALGASSANNITVTAASTSDTIWLPNGTASTTAVLSIAGAAVRMVSNSSAAWLGTFTY